MAIGAGKWPSMSCHEQFARSCLIIGSEMAERRCNLLSGLSRFSSISSILFHIIYRVAFILSFSVLMTTAIHHPKALRGLSRWTLAFVTNGPNAKLWKFKHGDEIVLSKTGSTSSISDTSDLNTNNQSE
jgi:hypothetical protein